MTAIALELAARTLRLAPELEQNVAQEWSLVADYIVSQLGPGERASVAALVDHFHRLAYAEGDDAVAVAIEVFTIKRFAR